MNKYEMISYYTDNGQELQVQLSEDTLWLTAVQIAQLFNVNRPAIVKHINNIYNSQELGKFGTCSKMEHIGNNGNKYFTNYYNLDVIISVGYRVNSKAGVRFRQWATKILRAQMQTAYLNYFANNQYNINSLDFRLTQIEKQGLNRVQCIKDKFWEHEERINAIEDKLNRLKITLSF